MLLLPITIASLLLFTACKTTQSESLNPQVGSLLSQSELHCRVQLPSENHKSVIVEAKFPSNSEKLAMLFLKRGDNNNTQIIASTVSPEKVITFEPNNQDKIAIRLEGQPRIASVFGSFNESQASPCVQLLTNSKSPTARPPTCNALGTPAQGWYQSGKLIQLSANCAHEALFCGAMPAPGWYIQKKTQRILAKPELCGWVRETPICKTGPGATGWHLGDRLIARDDECAYKHMECARSGTRLEGWYIYERSSPKLLAAGSCHTNRDISYLSH